MAVVKSVTGVDDSAHATTKNGSMDVEKTVENYEVNVDEEDLCKCPP